MTNAERQKRYRERKRLVEKGPFLQNPVFNSPSTPVTMAEMRNANIPPLQLHYINKSQAEHAEMMEMEALDDCP